MSFERDRLEDVRTGIETFNTKHDVDEDGQFKQLVEELGELSEALNRDADDETVGEELGDILFVASSIADLRGVNALRHLHDVTMENLEKDESTDGDKVTKSGLGDSKSESDQ